MRNNISNAIIPKLHRVNLIVVHMMNRGLRALCMAVSFYENKQKSINHIPQYESRASCVTHYDTCGTIIS